MRAHCAHCHRANTGCPILVVEGHSIRGIGERPEISQRAVQKHVSAIFAKLGLPAREPSERRILAVLASLGVRERERPGVTLG